MPDTLAPPVAGPMVWEGGELKDYVLNLIPSDIDAIRAAIISFKLKGLPREKIDKNTFPLPNALSQKLNALTKDVHIGLGVAVIRGLHRAKFNHEEWVIAFAGVTSHICPLRASDSFANQALSHIRDATYDKVPAGAENIGLAGSKIPVKMEFHSDRFSGDVLALMVVNDGSSQKGGEQLVCSFSKIYNTLLETEPAVLETMAASDWPFELKQKNDAPPHLDLGPTLFFSRGKPMCQLVKAPLLGTPQLPRDGSMPDLSAEQIHALEVIENLARRFSTKLDRQQGDIQLINNLSILHARSAYGEKDKPSDRHLLRMFLRDPDYAWDKPATWSAKFDDPFTPGRPQELPIVDTDPRRKISGRESHG